MWYWNRPFYDDIPNDDAQVGEIVREYFTKTIPEEDVEAFINRRNDPIMFRDGGNTEYSAAKAIFFLDRQLYDKLRRACVNFKTASFCIHLRARMNEIEEGMTFKQFAGIDIPLVWHED